MENAASRFKGLSSAFHLGSHSLPALFVLTAISVLVTALALPFLTFIFGRGWVAPFIVLLFLWVVVLVLRRLLFHRIYKHVEGEGDAALIEYFVQQNAMGPQEEDVSVELLENALHLKRMRVNDCMSPRPEIVHIDVSESIEALRQQFVESSLSRIVVTNGDIDQFLGYVHVQQLFTRPSSIREIVMPITIVPETLPIDEVLQKFIQARRSIAIVVDEYGSVAGIISLEDALEQLFGEIDDEHDQEEYIETVVGEGEFLFSGRLRIDYLNEHYPELGIPQGDYQTLAGYVMTGAGTIPKQGDTVELEGKRFVLELVSDRKIETVRILTGY